MNSEADSDFQRVQSLCSPHTLCSPERNYALYQAVCYVTKHQIPGTFVECGVYKGASSMLAAYAFAALGSTEREFYLYDTFDGMPPPSEHDRDYGGRSVDVARMELGVKQYGEMYRAGLSEVQDNMRSTGYPESKLHYVVGKVEDTLPQQAPAQISILRLDTDWYESTYHELVHLFPRLSPGGVLIIDDYGHWQGARRAVDQYLAETNARLLLNRIDFTGRIAVKL